MLGPSPATHRFSRPAATDWSGSSPSISSNTARILRLSASCAEIARTAKRDAASMRQACLAVAAEADSSGKEGAMDEPAAKADPSADRELVLTRMIDAPREKV